MRRRLVAAIATARALWPWSPSGPDKHVSCWPCLVSGAIGERELCTTQGLLKILSNGRIRRYMATIIRVGRYRCRSWRRSCCKAIRVKFRDGKQRTGGTDAVTRHTGSVEMRANHNARSWVLTLLLNNMCVLAPDRKACALVLCACGGSVRSRACLPSRSPV